MEKDIFDMNLVSKNTSYGNINVVLDDIRDPGNLGSIIRTCDWFNVNKIYEDLYFKEAFRSFVFTLFNV